MTSIIRVLKREKTKNKLKIGIQIKIVAKVHCNTARTKEMSLLQPQNQIIT